MTPRSVCVGTDVVSPRRHAGPYQDRPGGDTPVPVPGPPPPVSTGTHTVPVSSLLLVYGPLPVVRSHWHGAPWGRDSLFVKTVPAHGGFSDGVFGK